MKSTHLGNKVLLAITILGPGVMATPAAAQVSVGVSIGIPAPIVFVAPPQLVVLPGFDIYVAPGIAEEIYFVDGYWWRPWQGHWYRSASYDSGWDHYSSVPYFYGNIRQDWRSDYRNHRWEGRDWNYESVPYSRVQQNWSSWKSTNYWRSQEHGRASGSRGGQQGHDQGPAAGGASPHRGSQAQSPKSQHQAVAPKAAQSQRHSAPSPKAAQQQQHGGGQPQARKQNSKPAKASPARQAQDHGDGGKGNAQPAAQHGGGKGKK